MRHSSGHRGARAGVRRLFSLPFHDAHRANADADAELEGYLADRTASLIAQGMTPDDARAEALDRLGGPLNDVRATLHHSAQHREARLRRRELFDDLIGDTRYVARNLRRHPAFTLAAVACLAIAIGANTTMFAVVDSLLLRPPAGVRDPGGLLWINARRTNPMSFTEMAGLTYPDYLELSQSSVTARAAAYYTGEDVLEGDRTARKVATLKVTPTFMTLLGVNPVLGRFFAPDDDRIEAAPTAILSYDLWQAQFSGVRSVVGMPLRIGGVTYAIIGVAPKDFNGVERTNVDVFLPTLAGATDPTLATTRRSNWLMMLARPKPGATRDRIVSELDAIYHRAPRVGRSRDASKIVVAAPMSTVAMRNAVAVQNATVAGWLAFVASIVLAIACANVASLLLTRAVQRRREIAIRLALGIGRWRLVRLLIAESVAIAAIGGAGGLLLAKWGGGVFRASLIADGARSTSVFDLRVLLATLFVTAITGIVCGLAPALQATRPDLTEAMKTGDGAADHRAERWLGGLLVGQVALTVVLLVGAGLFVRSTRNLDILDLGFDVRQLLRARVSAPAGATRIEADELAHHVLAEASALPGVERVALATAGPFGNGMTKPIFVPDRIAEESSIPPGMSAVTPDFFRTLGIPLVDGRTFQSTDRIGTEPVVIVNDALAKHLWSGGSAVGKCIKLGSASAPCARIVGVVGNARQGNITRQSIQYEQIHDGFYVALEQQPVESRVWVFGTIMLYVRAKGEGAALVPSLARTIAEQSPGSRAPDVVAFAQAVEPQIRPWRVGVMMFGAFGVIGLVLAVVGLHGVLAFRVAQRTREIGVRLALGATARDVYRVVLEPGVRLGGIGVALGAIGALTVGHGLGALLFGVSPRDPVVLVSICGTLLVAVLLASVIPAYRANRIDPIAALRDL